MAYLVRGEHDRDAVRGYLLEALDFCWSVQDSGGLEWEDEPGYVQWAGWPEGVQIEISGEQFLGRAWTEQERRRLVELGFAPPQDDLPDHWRRFTSPSELPVAADVLVTCLFEILTPPPVGQLPEVEPGQEEAPTSAPGRILTLAPIGKVDPRDVRQLVLTVAGLLNQSAPVAVVDAFMSNGLELPYRDEGRVDEVGRARAPRMATDRLLLSGWEGGDHDDLALQRVAGSVAEVVARLQSAGWEIVLVGPPVFFHTLWAYQKVALPVTGRLLMIGGGYEWEHRTEDVARLVEAGRAHGLIEEVAVVVSHEPPQAALQHLTVHERWVRPADLAGPLTWLHHWLGVHQPEAAAAGPIDVPAVLLRVSREWYPGIDEDQLYDVTYGWWVMGPKRERAEYAFAVAKGQIRGVWRIHGWRPRHDKDENGTPTGRVRWGFDGEPADELAHLIGVDVAQYFPAGAANPVRYLNCDGPALQGPVAEKAEPAPAEAPSSPRRTAELTRICAELQANPVLHMSLGSKELFHSNLLGWICESDPFLARNALVPWWEPGEEPTRHAVHREKHDLDLVVELPGLRPIVIENKVFSLPDEEQLDRYAEHNVPAAGLVDPTLLLLSLTDPGWPDGTCGKWRWVSYDSLTYRILQALDDRPQPDPFSDELIRRWVAMVRLLGELLALVEPDALDEPLLLDGEDVEILKTVRLHDALQKARTRRVRHLLEQRYAERGLSYDFIESAFGMGGPLLSAGVYLPDGCLIGWQLQGNHFRRFLIAPDELAGGSAAQKQARIDYVDAHHRGWFDFAAEQALGPFLPAPSSAYKHFAPAFVYDYVKVPGITVQQVLELGEVTLRSAIGYRDRR
jgi:hypothetical protein